PARLSFGPDTSDDVCPEANSANHILSHAELCSHVPVRVTAVSRIICSLFVLAQHAFRNDVGHDEDGRVILLVAVLEGSLPEACFSSWHQGCEPMQWTLPSAAWMMISARLSPSKSAIAGIERLEEPSHSHRILPADRSPEIAIRFFPET